MSWDSLWPNCDEGSWVNLSVNGVSFPAGIRPELKDLATLLLQETERMGYHLHPGWCWGAACRPIAGTSSPSNHSGGRALDINAPENPYGERGKIPMKVVTLWERFGWAWGGRWANSDSMHFEATRSQSAYRTLTRRAKKELEQRKLVYKVAGKTFGKLSGAMRAFRRLFRKPHQGEKHTIQVIEDHAKKHGGH